MNSFDYNNFQVVSETITNAIKGFANIFHEIQNLINENREAVIGTFSIMTDLGTLFSAAEILAKNQIVFTDDLHLDFAKAICDDADNVDDLVKQYYFQNEGEHLNVLIKRCYGAKQTASRQGFFDEIIEALNREHYMLACVGLFSLVDGLLSEVESTMKNAIKFNKRLESIQKKVVEKTELCEFDLKTMRITESIDKLDDYSIFAFSNFSGEEPNGLNRHWLVHGRTTRRDYSRYDFLKILLWLDAIIFLDNVNNDLDELDSTDITETNC